MRTFEELAATRRSYVEAARTNGFEDGLRNLLAELYPDNAHFIYELLQNAEDAGAHEVTFDLRPGGLQVEHDGARLFDLADIESITGIGKSTKVDEATAIGKFGVGFKAVFAYTQTPTVHSGWYSFAIHDLFVPTPVPSSARDGRTTFWFPFDRRDKPAGRAVREVAAALREISATTLLFLNNIQMIACTLPGGEQRLLARSEVAEHIVRIDSVHGQEAPSYWYRATGKVAVGGRNHSVAAAFALTRRTAKGSAEYAVRPVPGQVFIYFPAVKETSGLRFHIHAPFASTVARDSVRDDRGNDRLIAAIADLVAHALPAMRDAGLITDSTLNALPNQDDEIPERYRVLRDRILHSFNTEALTPVLGGTGHAPATHLLRSEPVIREAVTIEDAVFLRLYNDRNARPVHGWLPTTREGRAGRFLATLNAPDFHRDALGKAFSRASRAYTQVVEYENDAGAERTWSEWEAWLSTKTEAWLRRFYLALTSLVPQHRHAANDGAQRFAEALATAPILRVHNGDGFDHRHAGDAYLPTAPGQATDGLILDSLAWFEDRNHATSRRELRDFYEIIGVNRWDAAAKLDARLEEYRGQPAVVDAEHLADLRELGRLIDEKAVAPEEYVDRPILVAVDRNDHQRWAPPPSVYLDEPFSETGLATLYRSRRYHGISRLQLAAEYASASIDIGAIAVRLGARDGLAIAPASVFTNPQFEEHWRADVRENHNLVATDWTVENLDLVLDADDEALLRQLWRLIATADDTYAYAAYRANGSSDLHPMESQLAQKLSTAAWILDRDGNLRIPEDMTAEDLPVGMHLPTQAPLLDAVGFGRNATVDATRRETEERQAREFGFETAAELREVAEFHKNNPEEFRALMLEFKRRALPEASSSTPDQRVQRTRELSAEAPARRYEKRTRSVLIQEPGHHSASRGYLTGLYTNRDGELICQICSSVMPFKIGDDYYFEAVQFLKGARRDFPQNRLALCPTCAAKYRHALDTPLEDLRDDLLDSDVGNRGSITVDVVLAGRTTTVRFVGKHAIDMQAALQVDGGFAVDEAPS